MSIRSDIDELRMFWRGLNVEQRSAARLVLVLCTWAAFIGLLLGAMFGFTLGTVIAR